MKKGRHKAAHFTGPNAVPAKWPGRKYERVKARKRPLRMRTRIEKRFWAKVAKPGPDECWLWLGFRSTTGYGQIGLGGKGSRKILAHRYSYELRHGPIPNGLIVRHSCHNSSCVNPAHLLTGTAKDNTQDMLRAQQCIGSSYPVVSQWRPLSGASRCRQGGSCQR